MEYQTTSVPPLLVDPYAAHVATGVKPGTTRQWLARGHLTHHGYDQAGRALLDLHELQAHVMARAA